MKITKSQLKRIIKEELESVIERSAKQKAGSLPSGDTGERFNVIGKDDMITMLPGGSEGVESELYDPMLVVTTKVFKKLREAEDLLRDFGEADAMKMRTIIVRASKYVAREMGRLQAERSEQMAGLVGQTKQSTKWTQGTKQYRTIDPDLITGDDI